jgi:hypothetical protein
MIDMTQALRRIRNADPDTLAHDAFGLAALCVAILAALLLPIPA